MTYLLCTTRGRVHFAEPGRLPACGVAVAEPLPEREGELADVTCRRCLALEERGRMLHVDLDSVTSRGLEAIMASTGERASVALNRALHKYFKEYES